MSDLVKWFAMPNDLIGGWCVVDAPVSPSQIDHNDPDRGARVLADFTTEKDARHIADLQNAHVEDCKEAFLTDHQIIDIQDNHGNTIAVIDGQLADDVVTEAVSAFIHKALENMIDKESQKVRNRPPRLSDEVRADRSGPTWRPETFVCHECGHEKPIEDENYGVSDWCNDCVDFNEYRMPLG